MSRWNHAICDGCWTERNPHRVPVRIAVEFVQAEPCCYCDGTARGIFVRADPETVPCAGNHGDEP